MPASAPTFQVEDARLALTLIREPNVLHATLTDKATGRTWGPTPLLGLDVHDRTLRRVEPKYTYRIDAVETVEGGFHVVVGDPDSSINVGLWLRLCKGELSVLLSPPEVYEPRPAHFRLFAVNLLPNLLQVDGDGMLLMPLGSGCLCSPRGKNRVSDQFLIYLEQDRWELAPTLPYSAVWDPTGGMMILATQGAADAQCRVYTDGKDNGRVNFAFSLRRFWPDPVEFENREFRFVPFALNDTGGNPVMTVANRLRQHVTDDLGKPTLKARIAESPELQYLLGAYTMKLFYARENEGYEARHNSKKDPISYLLGMTFAECRDGLTKIHAAGIDQVLTMSVGWNARGHDGLYPMRFPIDERLGGERAFRELIAYGNDALGYHMNLHDNFGMNIASAPNFDTESLIHDMHGEPLLSGWWGGGLEYQTWGHALSRERLEGHLERLRDLGIRGMFYCDYMMRPLEVNYHPRWRGGRSAHASGQVKVFDAAKATFGAVATEYGILPACISADYLSAGGAGRHCRPEWPIRELMDHSLPMWSLVLHGLVFQERTGLEWSHVMDAVLYGKHPRDEWTVRTAVGHPELTPTRIAKQKAVYDLVLKRYGHLQTEIITSYSELADKVTRTTFADGTEVTADLAKQELFVNGTLIPCPEVLKGKA